MFLQFTLNEVDNLYKSGYCALMHRLCISSYTVYIRLLFRYVFLFLENSWMRSVYEVGK